MNFQFPKIERLPPYVFSILQELKDEARQRGEDIIDLGMGNPSLPTPSHIVDKAQESLVNPNTHRYSVSRGVPNLRQAICDWYQRKFEVSLDSDREAIVTLGAKEGLAHLILAIISPGDNVIIPNPTYPIHEYSTVIAGGDYRTIPIMDINNFQDEYLDQLESVWKTMWPQPKAMILCFPHNPTTAVVDIKFFEQIVAFAKKHNTIVIHDFAYADLVFDGYVAPSILQVPGAKDVAVEIYSMSKGYNMPGWRVGFVCGNSKLVAALARMKSYLDYGIFLPIQIASICALNGETNCVEETRKTYEELRDVLVDGLNDAGWSVEKPKATMFVWAKMPKAFLHMGSLDFCKTLLKEAKVVVSPGIGFGQYGENYVRFALVENKNRIRQAVRGIKKFLQSSS